MISKIYLIAAMLSCISFTALSADSTVLGGDLFDKGKRLSVDEIKTLVAKDVEVEQINGSTGGIRRWKNNADGKFVASRIAATGGSGRSITGTGEWKLTDNGQYCVAIEWRPLRTGPEQESWCRTLWKYEDAIFLAPLDLAANRERKYGQVKFTK